MYRGYREWRQELRIDLGCCETAVLYVHVDNNKMLSNMRSLGNGRGWVSSEQDTELPAVVSPDPLCFGVGVWTIALHSTLHIPPAVLLVVAC